MLWIQRRERFRTTLYWRHRATGPEQSASSMPTPRRVWSFIWSLPHHCLGETVHQLVTAQAFLGIDLTPWVIFQVRFLHPIQASSSVTLTNRFHYLCQKKAPSFHPGPYFPWFFYHGFPFYYIFSICLFHMKTQAHAHINRDYFSHHWSTAPRIELSTWYELNKYLLNE